MNEKIQSLWKIVVANRGKIIFGMTASAFLLLMYKNARNLEVFMKDHGLLEEYHQWLTIES